MFLVGLVNLFASVRAPGKHGLVNRFAWKVYVSVYNVENREETVDRLNAHAHEIRRKVGDQMRHQLRHIPEFEFRLDSSLDKVFRMDDLLKDL